MVFALHANKTEFFLVLKFIYFKFTVLTILSLHCIRRKRRKRNIDTASPIAIVSITPSLLRGKRSGIIRKLAASIFSSVFVIPRLTAVGYCHIWHASQNPEAIKELQGNPKEKDLFFSN